MNKIITYFFLSIPSIKRFSFNTISQISTQIPDHICPNFFIFLFSILRATKIFLNNSFIPTINFKLYVNNLFLIFWLRIQFEPSQFSKIILDTKLDPNYTTKWSLTNRPYFSYYPFRFLLEISLVLFSQNIMPHSCSCSLF